MSWQYILYSVDSGVAHVVLNRPEKLNALGMGPGSNRGELAEALEQADADPAAGAIRCTDLAERLARMPREAVMLTKASIDSMLEAAGRGAGRSVGRLHDMLTQ